MPTDCSAAFGMADGRAVVCDFGGGAITSDAGALLLGDRQGDRAIHRFAACFTTRAIRWASSTVSRRNHRRRLRMRIQIRRRDAPTLGEKCRLAVRH
jgi:hypothetical protein